MQAVQSAHAAVEYAARHPEVAGCTLVMLSVPDEESLAHFAVLLRQHGVDAEWFYEPDLDEELTAVAAAGDKARRRLARLPLLFREEVMSGERGHVMAAG